MKLLAKMIRKRGGYILLEVVVSATILALTTGGIIGLFLTAERRAMFSIMQNKASNILREETEKVIALPYVDVVSMTTNYVLLSPSDTNAPTNARYEIEVTRNVFSFPKATAPNAEPRFKIVNVEGVWTFRGITYTNVIQTVALP